MSAGAFTPPGASQPRGSTTHPGAPDPQQQQRAAIAALRSPMIPRLYANSFGIGQTAADLTLIFVTNGSPTGSVSMSYPVAKQLVELLQGTLDNIESAMKQKVLSATDIEKALQDVMSKKNATNV
jgi:hypothetical protein